MTGKSRRGRIAGLRNAIGRHQSLCCPTGPCENLAGAFVSKDAAIEHIAGRIRENSGAHPEVKLGGKYRTSVLGGWTCDETPRSVYVLL